MQLDLAQQLRIAFYRAKFDEILAELETILATRENIVPDCLPWFCYALFETFRVDQARKLVREFKIRNRLGTFPIVSLVEGNIYYMSNQHEEALKSFSFANVQSKDHFVLFRSLLGMGNVFYSFNKIHELRNILDRIAEACPELSQEETLQVKILRSNACRLTHAFDEARVLGFQVFGKSLQEGWSLLTIRSLYLLACIEQDRGDTEERDRFLEPLRHALDGSSWYYCQHLVNTKFSQSNQILYVPFEMNERSQSVKIWGKEVPLHQSPRVFQFLQCLYKAQRFVSKEEVAEVLWPGETYFPTIHDSRISDLVRRVKKLIEKWEEEPILLLSSRAGYRLASKKKEKPFINVGINSLMPLTLERKML